jgi:hypothetical protein
LSEAAWYQPSREVAAAQYSVLPFLVAATT